ncbi:MAG: ATP-binding cassette domain-containing protein [Methanophagales archaeon]|nr:ATP-binding cassette domain-containing protein [Methanophagales archaeon]MCW3137964.1 ATP-binding cassette domain-containing protein [Methanophagales archaeon]MCW7073656.1 ATP-binding cassette domain-containing protein [Methanophagales archaeon]
MKCAVNVTDLFYTYPDGTEALKGVNFKVMEGERVAVIGSNGSGKSTLFYHLNGLFSPTKGTVLINEEEITKTNLDKIRMTVGLVFQDPDDQLFAPTVWEDVAFGPRNMGLSKREVAERVNSALNMLHIADLKDKRPDNLSGGQKRLVSIAGVLAMNPEIIVLDEPTSNLDPCTSSAVMHLLVDLSRRMNIALIIATHDVDAIPQYADRIYVMHRGRFVAEGTPEAVFSNASVVRESHLRLPRIARLMEILHKEDNLPLKNPYPLTIRGARNEIMRVINDKRIKG